ncbi:MAG: hypothetical protein U0996_21765 [Planctomycetaceae bacterium]
MKTPDTADDDQLRPIPRWQTSLLIAQTLSTFYMVGVIWFVQIVHYPMFAFVGVEQFPAWEQRNVVLTTWIVGPGMLVEAISAVGLFFVSSLMVPRRLAVAGVLLLAMIWLSTHFLQVPCHDRLASGFDSNVHQMLVRSNWLRTLFWALRGLLVIGLLKRALSASAYLEPK